MAVVTVSFDGTRADDAEAITNWMDMGGKSTSLDPDIVWQGTYAVSEKISTGQGGVGYIDPTGIDFETTPRVALFKVTVSNPAALLAFGLGQNLVVGTDEDNYWRYFLNGAETYPAKGGTILVPLDPNLVGFRDELVGSAPTLTSLDFFAHECDFSTGSRAENVVMDAFDYILSGSGLTLVGGDGAEDDGIFQDFIDEDEGQKTDGRWGVVTTQEGVIFVIGTLTIGSATATVFQDSNQVLVFLGGVVNEGFAGIDISLAHATTDVDWEACVFRGRGLVAKKKFFDTALEVTSSTEGINLPSHGYETMDYVSYSKEGGSDAIGLADAAEYWVYVVDVDTIVLHDVRADAFTYGTLPNSQAFHTQTDVDDAAETIAWPSHGLEDGQPIFYDKDGGTDAIGLTDLTTYYAHVVTAGVISVHANYADAVADTNRINLTDGTTGEEHLFDWGSYPVVLTAVTAPGENHSLKREPDNRPDLTVTGTSGEFDTAACVFQAFRTLTLTSAVSIIGGFILDTGQIVASTATLTGVILSGMTTEEGEALFTALSTLANITGCTMTAGDDGHLFEITSGGTMTSNNEYTGFWSPTDLGWNFHTQTGIASNIITTDAAHGFVDGDAVYYNDEGGTDDILLVDGDKYYVNVPSATTLTVHATKAAAIAGTSIITLQDGSGGETHSLYGAHATLYNNSGTSATINVTTGSSAPSVRNGTGASTTVNVSVTITITVKDEDQVAIQGVQTAIYKTSDKTEIMNEDTTAGGIATEDYSGSTPVEVEVRCRKASPGDTKYRNFSTIQTIGTGGLTLAVTLTEDPLNIS